MTPTGFWNSKARGPFLAVLLLGLPSCAAATPPLGGQAPVTGVVEGPWQLVWADEFSGTVIEGSRWSLEEDCWGGGNRERQCYTAEPENAAVREGMLIISARHEQASGRAFPASMQDRSEESPASVTRQFTSARLTTRGKASWLYGKVEIRARLPQGQGTWPALWMLPEEDGYGRWAQSGEIDILEAVNLGVSCAQCASGREDTILGTLHFGGASPDNTLASTEIHYPAVLDGFHTFGIVWSAGRVIWTIDGQVYATRTADEWQTTATDAPNAPFDRPFHLVMNLAIGGGLPESRGLGGVSTENYPKALEIDWVRVWQCGTDPASPASCAPEGG